MEYLEPTPKHQKFSTLSLDDLPDEVILRVFSNLGIKDLIRCGQVSKRTRAISQDEQLWLKINLYFNNSIPTGFLEYVLNNGCKYLCLAFAQIAEIEGEESLKYNASQLKYLDLSFCQSSHQVFDDLLSSCHSLEKLALDTYRQRILHDDLVKKMCCQFGSTLQVLDLSNCNGTNMEILRLEIIQLMIDSFSQLKEVNFRDTYLSEESLDYVSNNLSETVVKVGLSDQINLKYKHSSALVNRCSNLTSLDLSQCDLIGNPSLTNIIQSLKLSLEELDISGTNIDSAKILELQSMSRLKLLICSDFEDIFALQGLLPNLTIELCGRINIASSMLPKSSVQQDLQLEEGFWEIDAKQLQLFKSARRASDSDTSFDDSVLEYENLS